MLCTASDTFRILAYSELCLFRYMPVYLIQRYYDIFTHIETLLRHVQAYSDIFSTLCNPRIFKSLRYSEPVAHLKLREGLIRNIQNPFIGHHWASFSHIQAYAEPCATFAYAEAWDTWNPGIFRNLYNSIPTHIQNSVILT